MSSAEDLVDMFDEIAVSAQSARTQERASKVEYSEILVRIDAVYTAIANFNVKCSVETLKMERLSSKSIIRDRGALASAINNKMVEIDEYRYDLVARGVKIPDIDLYDEEIDMLVDEWGRATRNFKEVAWKLYCSDDIAGYPAARQMLKECFNFYVEYSAIDADVEMTEKAEDSDDMEENLDDLLEDMNDMDLG